MSIEKTRPAHGGHGARGITMLLRRMHDIVASEATAQERLDQLTHVIAGYVVADVCSIYLRLPNDRLELYATEGLNREAVHKTQLRWGEGLVGLVCATQKPHVTAEAPLHPAFSYRKETGEDPLHSFLGVPLIRSGKALGVLVLQNKKPRRYDEEEVEAAQAVATLLAEIAASGELFGEDTEAEVGALLHEPVSVKGTGLVPGVAIGKAAFHEAPVARRKVFTNDTAGEAKRLEQALDALRSSVDTMLSSDDLGSVSREVLETYRLFAYDRGWKERLRAAVFSGMNAESAVDHVQGENRSRMQQARSPYLRERLHDLDDLSFRLLRHLSGEPDKRPDIPDEAIIIARFMGPADLLEYDRAKIRGLVLGEASETSHVAIVARAMGLPVVVDVENIFSLIDAGDDIVIDGATGDVQIRANDDMIASYRETALLQSERQAAFAREANDATVTRDGVAIDILMNAGLTIDLPNLAATGAAGVGLFRTELQFLIGSNLPSASTQEELYTDILNQAGDKPVVFRTADLGGDKTASYMRREAEANPAMGWRGIRMAIDRPGILRPQLRALLSAAAGRELRVLFPMITTPAEVRAARAALEREWSWRQKRGHPMPEKFLVGAMIEIPAAAWCADAIAADADFLSIGGNDLAQFYFAADRDTALTRRRYDPVDTGFLSFIRMTVEKTREGGASLSYCGEQAADLVMAAALLGVGLRALSTPASAVGPLRRLIRAIDLSAFAEWLTPRLASGEPNLRRDIALWLRSAGVPTD